MRSPFMFVIYDLQQPDEFMPSQKDQINSIQILFDLFAMDQINSIQILSYIADEPRAC